MDWAWSLKINHLHPSVLCLDQVCILYLGLFWGLRSAALTGIIHTNFTVILWANEKQHLLFETITFALLCKSGNFRSTLIFALFAKNFTNAKIKTRQYVSLVQRSMGVNSERENKNRPIHLKLANRQNLIAPK